MMRTRAATAAVLVLTGAITGVAPATAGIANAKTAQHHGKPRPKQKPSPKVTGWTVTYSGSGVGIATHEPAPS